MLLCSIIVGKDTNETVSGDFGILLCVPACSYCESYQEYRNDFRYILLWRKRIKDNLEEVADAFGMVAMTSYALFKWRHDKRVYDGFQHLGPNCARFGERVSVLVTASFLMINHAVASSSSCLSQVPFHLTTFSPPFYIFSTALQIVRQPR